MGIATEICGVLLEEFESDFRAEWNELSRLRALRGTGEGSEDARLRLDNIRASSTTPERIVQALEKNVLTYLGVMRDHLHKAVVAAIKLEHANREIEATKRLVEVRARQRAETEATELYPETKRVIDQLYEHHGIAMGHFSTLRAEDIAEVAAVIMKRFHEATGGSG